jgi:hypothetical protein
VVTAKFSLTIVTEPVNIVDRLKLWRGGGQCKFRRATTVSRRQVLATDSVHAESASTLLQASGS